MATIDLGKLRFHFAGEWDASALYEPNDVVKYGGNLYCYTFALKQAGILPTNTAYWVLTLEGVKFRGVFSAATDYRIGDAVAYGARVYVAIKDCTGTVPPNATYWSLFADGIQYEGTYSGTATYQKNDVVSYGGRAYIAKQDTTGNLPTVATHWDKFVDGISPQGVYNTSKTYLPGDVVAYGATLYIAKQDTTGNLPTVATYWDKFLDGVRGRGDYAAATAYYPSDVVTYGGNTYICLVYHASTVFETDLAAGKWQKFNGGIRWRGAWATGMVCLIDDVVRFGASTYRATTTHTAGAAFPADLAAGKWEFLAQGAEFATPDPTSAPNGKALVVQNGVFVLGDVAIKTLVVASSTALVANTIYALDSTAGRFPLTLPASPTAGDTVRLFDAGGNLSGYPVTVLGNGQRINTLLDDLLMDADGADITLTFINAAIGWKVH